MAFVGEMSDNRKSWLVGGRFVATVWAPLNMFNVITGPALVTWGGFRTTDFCPPDGPPKLAPQERAEYRAGLRAAVESLERQHGCHFELREADR